MPRLIARLRHAVTERRLGYEASARRAGVAIGTDCRVLSRVATSEPWLVRIGDRVTVSSEVHLVTHDGSGSLVADDRGRRYRYARIDIGSDVFIGARATLLPGVRIGDRCVVGAGSVVTRSVPSGTVVAGNPARVIGSWDDLRTRIADWPAADDLRGEDHRTRVESVVERGFLPDLAVPGRAA